MSYFVLSPEVCGGFGPETQLDTTVHPPIVHRLEYVFEGWLGDDLIETFPVFLVTEQLGEALQRHGLSGFTLENVLISSSLDFDERQPDTTLPRFWWLKVTGSEGESDFACTPDARLLVSERALAVLTTFSIKHCEIARHVSTQA